MDTGHALLEAAAAGDISLVEALKAAPAFGALPMEWIGSALRVAAEQGQTAIVDLLLRSRRAAHIAGNFIFTALLGACEARDPALLTLLLDHEKRFQTLDLDQMGEALLYVVETGQVETLKLLMALPRFAKVGSSYLNRALTLAASCGHKGAMLTLLAYDLRLGKLHPATLDEARREAADGGFEACVQVLLEQRPL